MTQSDNVVPTPGIVREEIKDTDILFPTYYRIHVFNLELNRSYTFLRTFKILMEAEQFALDQLTFDSMWTRAHIEEVRPVVRILKNPR